MSSHVPLGAKGLSPSVVILFLFVIGFVMVVCRIHGFSFSMWHSAIDDSPHQEILLNTAKGIRSDDWIVALPHCLSQRAHSPAFPVANSLIGDGHYNMRIGCAAPVRDLVFLFRPQIWGYFISGDIGMAFQWWFNVLGIWISVWLVIRRLTGNDFWLSVCGATALLFSPFFQAWSLNCAPPVIFACMMLLALIRIWTATSTLQILLAVLLLIGCSAAFMLTFNYMPYLVTLLYLVLFVFIGMWRRLKQCSELPEKHWPRWGGTALAVLAVTGLGAYILISNWETIDVIRNSEYPGQRVSHGGDQTIWHLFRGNVLSIKPPHEWRDFHPCEGAAFFLVFPVVVAALARNWWRTRKAPDALVVGISGYLVFLLIWNLMGFSETLSRWTLMNRAPPFRTLIGLGIADLFLLAVYASDKRQASPAPRTDNITPWVICGLWIVFHVCLGLKVSRYFPEYSLTMALIGGIFSMALGPLLYLAPRLVLPAMMMASILTTYDVNPLARGGTAFIEKNPLSQKIQTLDQESRKQGRHPVWIVYSDLALPNLFRMIGSHALNGVHAYPQLELWKALDPEGQYRTAYNRYAHVVFELPSAKSDFNIHLVQADFVKVYLHPEHPRFADLNVDYVLCLNDQIEQLDRVPKMKKIFSYAGKHIYGAERAIYRVCQAP